MSKVVNAAPMNLVQNAREANETSIPNQDRTAGSNASGAAHAFEQRVTQEVGTH